MASPDVGRYVALLRGINVGGKNLIKMTELKICLEKQGLRDVVTYIQSGNVLFTSADAGSAKLVRQIEAALVAAFDYRASVVLRSRKQLQDIVGRAPKGFGTQPDRFRYDVIYLKAPLSAAAAIKSVPTNPEVDQVHAGTGVLYFSRLISKATQSRLSRLISLPIYQSVTIRNWNTTTKLLHLMEASSE
jgi:uncharacterized protein (DUF1697 family)